MPNPVVIDITDLDDDSSLDEASCNQTEPTSTHCEKIDDSPLSPTAKNSLGETDDSLIKPIAPETNISLNQTSLNVLFANYLNSAPVSELNSLTVSNPTETTKTKRADVFTPIRPILIPKENGYHLIKPIYPVVYGIPAPILTKDYGNRLTLQRHQAFIKKSKVNMSIVERLQKPEVLHGIPFLEVNQLRKLVACFYSNTDVVQASRLERVAGIYQIIDRQYYLKWIKSLFQVKSLIFSETDEELLMGLRICLRTISDEEEYQKACQFVEEYGGSDCRLDSLTQYAVFSGTDQIYELPPVCVPITLEQLYQLPSLILSFMWEDTSSTLKTEKSRKVKIWEYNFVDNILAIPDPNKFCPLEPTNEDLTRLETVCLRSLPFMLKHLWKIRNGAHFKKQYFPVGNFQVYAPFLASVDFSAKPSKHSLPKLFYDLGLPNYVPISKHQREDIEYWITLHYSTPAEQEVPKVSLVYKENNSFQVHIIAETIEKFIFSLTYGPHKPTIYLCDTNIVQNIENAFDFKFEKVTQNANDDAQLAKEKYVGRHLFWRNSQDEKFTVVVRPQKQIMVDDETIVLEYSNFPTKKWVIKVDKSSETYSKPLHTFLTNNLSCVLPLL